MSASFVTSLVRSATIPVIITATIVARIARFEADHAVTLQTLPPGIIGPVPCFHSVVGLTPPPPINPFDDDDTTTNNHGMARWHTQLMAVHDGTLCSGATSVIETPTMMWNGSMTTPCYLDLLHMHTLLPLDVPFVTIVQVPPLVHALAVAAKLVVAAISCLAVVLVH